MEFALFYEIPVARPWTRRSERDAYHEVLEQAVLGEQAGFHSLWTVEHHFLEEFSHCSNPEVLYGAIAARTSRLRLGYGVRLMPFPYNHPVRSAESAAVLDIISDGRVEFGTGRSSTRAELEGFGIDPHRTRELWEEAVDVIVAAWTNDVLEWNGRQFRIPPRRVLPKPIQDPHPPLWGATSSPDSHRIMGEKGMGLLSFTIGTSPEELKQRIDLYRDGLTRARPVGKFVNGRAGTFTMVNVAKTREQARANAAESFEWYARHGTEAVASVSKWMRELGQQSGTYAYGDALADLDTSFLTYDFLESTGACISGTPEACIETAKRYQAAGCDLLLCLMNPYKVPHRAVMESIELMGKHVIPALK
ncbi:MAG TPA: LLM class flavin-dependent oxidoreductase [Candidatus Dormibacteraeota bacterium]|nr:LLM class flavin-dependent oxidoreductase [Candidatus Dormibacteraeota bacterium]